MRIDEALKIAIRACNGEVSKWRDMILHTYATSAHKEAWKFHRQSYKQAADTLSALAADVEAMRSALEPFAVFFEAIRPPISDEQVIFAYNDDVLTYGDFKQARQALAKWSDDDERQ